MSAPRPIRLHVNGRDIEVAVPDRKLLSDTLREDCQLTGTHVGCEHGVCGACTVLVDGRPARACLVFASQMPGHDIATVESVAEGGRLSVLQQALHDAHGLQCGFCTPGIVMTFVAFLRDHPDPSDAQIRDALSGNLCRCTGYHNIVVAIRQAARQLRERAASEGSGHGLA
jgi:carbon-monoxide dehydrogenase small subunit